MIWNLRDEIAAIITDEVGTDIYNKYAVDRIMDLLSQAETEVPPYHWLGAEALDSSNTVELI